MFKKILISCVVALTAFSFAYWSQTPGSNIKSYKAGVLYDGLDRNPNSSYVHTNPLFVTTPIIPEGPRNLNGWEIGPEIPITGLTGYYDYQMNGNQALHLWRFSSTDMYADYMTATDSADFNGSRRTKIAYSDDDGATWQDLGIYPTVKSGFPSLSGKSDGVGTPANHYSVGTPYPAAGYINYDIAPGAGSFNGVQVPPNFAWPQVSRFSNGNMFVGGTTYQTAASDSIAAAVFNVTSNTFTTYNRLVCPAGVTGQSNMSNSFNTGTNNKAIILVNPYRETGGNWGATRIWSTLSTDNGTSWGTFVLLFDPHIIMGDSIAPNQNGACDVIMDNAGNYYWAFNSLGPSHLYVNGRLLVGKNATEPKIIAGTHTSPVNPIPQIPDAMVSQAFIANFDHPCFALSDDQQYIFISYSVPFQDDTLNMFNKCHIFYQYAKTSDMIFSTPIQITASGPNSYDERYASLDRIAINQGGYYTIYIVYQKDPQPGSFAYLDNAPESRASLMFRKITDATLIGVRNNNEIVKEFKLDQNYPNPFNPTTRITYSIGKESFVTIKVYDVVGKEVMTLVNNKESAGNKEVVFDATNLPSGVYFYTIKAGSFSDTKKMVLVK
jgi:hypothetical protein